jgi:MFS family permease
MAIVQTLVPDSMRATAFALIYLFMNLIGMGLGPLITGVLSDALRPWTGEDSLRYALVCLSPGYFWTAWHAWRASRTVARDLSV